MTESNDRITGLITDFFTGNISERDMEFLEQWVAESEANGKLFRRRLRVLNYTALAARMAAPAKIRNKSVWRWAVWPAAAAVAAVALWLTVGQGGETVPAIVPGSTDAVLFTEGRIIHLDEQAEVRARQGVVSVSDGDMELYRSTFDAVPPRLVVPRGGEYRLTLCDGTEVRLNSESSIVFPVSFPAGERRVELRGEAFFNVVHNPDKPFIVDLSEGSIAVYGTRFNVCDYEGEPLSAILVEGCIAYNDDAGGSVQLTPSERLTLNRATGEITVAQVSTSDYTSWIDNMFIFHAQSLDQIMTTLARWYDVEIVFAAPELKELILSGRLARDQDIRTLLNAYRNMGAIDYTVEERTITIKNIFKLK